MLSYPFCLCCQNSSCVQKKTLTSTSYWFELLNLKMANGAEGNSKIPSCDAYFDAIQARKRLPISLQESLTSAFAQIPVSSFPDVPGGKGTSALASIYFDFICRMFLSCDHVTETNSSTAVFCFVRLNKTGPWQHLDLRS